VADKKTVDEPVADFPGLIELVINEKNVVEFWRLDVSAGTRFVTRENGGVKTSSGDNMIWVPPPADSLPWLLPRSKEVKDHLEHDSDGAYFAALCDWLRSEVQLPRPEHVILLAAWVAHTHIVDLVHASPYVLLLGPPETGKSRTLGACIHAARRGVLTMTAREAALIRYAADFHASLALDTIDFMSVIRPIADFFAARTKDDGTVTTRVLDYKAGKFSGIRHFKAFGPTLVSSNKALSDDVIASRTLEIRACQSNQPFRTPITPELARPLRERGAAFRARMLMGAATRQLPSPPDLAPGRLGELMSGLALAVRICDPPSLSVLEELAREFADARRSEVRDTLEVELLRHCIERYETAAYGPKPARRRGARQREQEMNQTVTMKLRDFCQTLNTERQGDGERPLSSRKVSPILRTVFGIDPWIGAGNFRFITLRRALLADLAGRYGLNRPSEHVKVEEPKVQAEIVVPPGTGPDSD
jgi:hypothetical protein